MNRDVLMRAEIKRVHERLSKRELCSLYGFSYPFYMNSISNTNKPSQKMIDSLKEYLKTPTDEIYLRVFALRKTDEYHKALGIDEQFENNTVEDLISSGALKNL